MTSSFFLCLLRESQIQLIVFSTLPESFFFFFFPFNLKTCERDLLVVFIACSRISLKAATFTLTVAEILFQQCKSQG